MSSPRSQASASSEARLSAVPVDEKTPPKPPSTDRRGSRDDRRISRRGFLILLAALAILAIGFVVQSQRIGTFEEQVTALESHISVLSSDLASAESRVATFEREREEIRGAVGTLRRNLSALEAMVGSQAETALPPAPEAAGATETETESFEP